MGEYNRKKSELNQIQNTIQRLCTENKIIYDREKNSVSSSPHLKGDGNEVEEQTKISRERSSAAEEFRCSSRRAQSGIFVNHEVELERHKTIF